MKTTNKKRSSDFILSQPTSENKFDPRPLPSNLLRDLYDIAERKGLTDLCQQIREEQSRRSNE